MVPATRHLLRARDLLDARYAEPLDVATAAGAAVASRAHFSRRFRNAFGVSPHRYLIARRIERARHMLRSTDDTVLEVALAVGFQTAASFSRAFAQATGVSPTAYRRAHAPQSLAEVPTCVLMAWTRPVLEVPQKQSTNRKDGGTSDG